MGLGVWFSEDIAHILRGMGEGVSLLVAQRGLRDAADAAYVAGYAAGLRAVAISLGLDTAVGISLPSFAPTSIARIWEEERYPLAAFHSREDTERCPPPLYEEKDGGR